MKGKLIKSMLLALVLVTSINFGVAQSAHAATNSSTSATNSAISATSTTTIPAHANPGTKIEYDNNNNMKILSGKINVEAGSTSINTSLPKPQPGMTVAYDGTGEPAFIKINGKPYVGTGMSTDAANSAASESGYYEKYGAISWYDDLKGQSNHTLTDYDCATDQYVDNCALGTYIYAEDLSTDIWGTFQKWDIGNLQQLSPKRIVDVWDVDVFGDVFQLEDPEGQGLITNGYYYHY